MNCPDCDEKQAEKCTVHPEGCPGFHLGIDKTVKDSVMKAVAQAARDASADGEKGIFKKGETLWAKVEVDGKYVVLPRGDFFFMVQAMFAAFSLPHEMSIAMRGNGLEVSYVVLKDALRMLFSTDSFEVGAFMETLSCALFRESVVSASDNAYSRFSAENPEFPDMLRTIYSSRLLEIPSEQPH